MEDVLALWIRPRGETYSRIKQAIDNLAKAYSTTPEPHLTLHWPLTGNFIMERTYTLAKNLDPFDLTLTRIGQSEAYGQALFLKTDRSAGLLTTIAATKRMFNAAQEAADPHVSLAYGSFTPTQRREMIARIGAEFHLQMHVDHIELWNLGQQEKNAPPGNWRRIHSFRLG